MPLEHPEDLWVSTPHNSLSANQCSQGTWQYLATDLLIRPNAKCQSRHDIESLFWVVFYAAFRWFTPEFSKQTTKKYLHALFDEVQGSPDPSERTGGANKLVEVLKGVRLATMTQGTPLNLWLEKGRQLLQEWDRKATTSAIAFQQFAEMWSADTKWNDSHQVIQRLERDISPEEQDPANIPSATRTSNTNPPDSFDADLWYNNALAVPLPPSPKLPEDFPRPGRGPPPFDGPTKRSREEEVEGVYMRADEKKRRKVLNEGEGTAGPSQPREQSGVATRPMGSSTRGRKKTKPRRRR